jgi:long-chain acyl-CoA synthetase
LESDEKVQGEILKQLQVIGRKSGFASMEILVGVVLADEEWTPVNGLVTATNKLNRRVLSKRYANGIENAYLKSRT